MDSKTFPRSQTEFGSEEKVNFHTGTFAHDLNHTSTYSYYLLNAEMLINDVLLEKDDFIVFEENE